MTFGTYGLLYLGSQQSNHLSYDPDGTFRERMWKVGTSTGEFLSIDGIAFAPNGNKYIVDGQSAMITVVSTSGAVLDRWNPADVPRGLMVRPSDIVIGSSDDVYIASNELYLVHHFNLSS